MKVALLAEGVDRNAKKILEVTTTDVALLAEGVDRNHTLVGRCFGVEVALLAEGVDRNKIQKSVDEKRLGRPPRGGRG